VIALAFADDFVLQAGSGGLDARLLAVVGEELVAVVLVLLRRRGTLGDLLLLDLLGDGVLDLKS